MVAVATTWIVAVRRPSRISGSATGTSTLNRTCRGRHPHPGRRVLEVRVDAEHALVGGHQDRRDGQRDQRDQPRPGRAAAQDERQDQQARAWAATARCWPG